MIRDLFNSSTDVLTAHDNQLKPSYTAGVPDSGLVFPVGIIPIVEKEVEVHVSGEAGFPVSTLSTGESATFEGEYRNENKSTIGPSS